MHLQARLVPEAEPLGRIGRDLGERVEDAGEVLDGRLDRVAPADAGGEVGVDVDRRPGVELGRHGRARDGDRVLIGRGHAEEGGEDVTRHESDRLGARHELFRDAKVRLQIPVLDPPVRVRRHRQERERVVAQGDTSVGEAEGEVDGDEEGDVAVGGRVLEVRDIKGRHDFVWRDGEECARLIEEVVGRLTR